MDLLGGRLRAVVKEEQYFSSQQLLQVAETAAVSEELVNNHFKLSSGQWFKNRYDIKTTRDLAPHERVAGPVAQVIKYEGRKKQALLGSESYNFYKVCLQDSAILSTVRSQGLLLEPFLLYVLCHELVHVVRFSMYKQRYESVSEAGLAFDEEKKVHQLSYEILCRVSMMGMKQVFEFYKDWLMNVNSKDTVKNLVQHS